MKIITTYSDKVLISVPDFQIEGISAELLINPTTNQCLIDISLITRIKERPEIVSKYNLTELFMDELRYEGIVTPRNAVFVKENVIPNLIDLLDAVSDEFLNWVIGEIHAEIIPSRVLYDYRDREYLAEKDVYYIEDTLRDKIFEFGLYLVYLPTVEDKFYLRGIMTMIREEGIDKTIEKYMKMYEEKAKGVGEQGEHKEEHTEIVDINILKEELSERLKRDALSLHDIVSEYSIDGQTAERILKEIGAIFVPQIGGFVIISGDDVISAYEKLKQKLLERKEWKISMDSAIKLLTEEGLSPDMASAYIIKMIQMGLIIDKEGLLDFVEVRKELFGNVEEEKKKEKEIKETLEELDEFAKTEARALAEFDTPEEMVKRIKLLADVVDRKKFVMIMKRVLSYLYEYDEEKFRMLMDYLEEHYETTDLAILYNKLRAES